MPKSGRGWTKFYPSCRMNSINHGSFGKKTGEYPPRIQRRYPSCEILDKEALPKTQLKERRPLLLHQLRRTNSKQGWWQLRGYNLIHCSNRPWPCFGQYPTKHKLLPCMWSMNEEAHFFKWIKGGPFAYPFRQRVASISTHWKPYISEISIGWVSAKTHWFVC